MDATVANPTDVVVGEVVRRHRKRHGISLASLSKSSGISLAQLKRYEAGTNRLSMSRLFQLSDAVGIPSYYLIAEVIAVSSRRSGTAAENSPVVELLSSHAGQNLVEAVALIHVHGVDAAMKTIARLAEQYANQTMKNERPSNLTIAVDNDEQG